MLQYVVNFFTIASRNDYETYATLCLLLVSSAFTFTLCLLLLALCLLFLPLDSASCPSLLHVSSPRSPNTITSTSVLPDGHSAHLFATFGYSTFERSHSVMSRPSEVCRAAHVFLNVSEESRRVIFCLCNRSALEGRKCISRFKKYVNAFHARHLRIYSSTSYRECERRMKAPELRMAIWKRKSKAFRLSCIY